MITVPMAGLSARFQRAGFLLPKYMLEAHGRSLFDYAILSFKQYFAEEEFLFICRDVQGTEAFVASQCARLGIRRWRIAVLDAPTRGQADTVYLGLEKIGVDAETPLTIFNIDTFRPGFRYPKLLSDPAVAGYLEVFPGKGANWSFARTSGPDSDRVLETAEKRQISNLCCTGLYQFQRAGDFIQSFLTEEQRPIETLDAKELYIAPLYNHLIRQGKDIRVDVIAPDDVIFCGVPEEYESFLRIPNAKVLDQ